jgi:predicted permease
VSWFDGIRARLRLVSRQSAESRFDREMRFHVEMEAERLARDEGVPPEEARRRALASFGGLEQHREALRAGRPFSWMTGLPLNLRVGVRMLRRYPGISAVGTAAIAIAVALGATYFTAVDKLWNPRLPVRDADRIVSIHEWDVATLSEESRTLHDFAAWRDQLQTIENLGAAISFQRNLATEDGRVEPVQGAELTANAFRLMGTMPLRGRTLSERDEQPGEPPVVVIGYSLWTRRFDSDPNVIDRTIRLGTAYATIVGVMPEGFGFPVNEQIWAPLRTDGSVLPPRTGPRVSIFGRLAPGKSLADARAELALAGARLASANPTTHEKLKAIVTGYQQPLSEGGESLWFHRLTYLVNTIFLLVLAVMCANIATLVYARTATRNWEITVRSALGASRARIVGQLFAEALVLAAVGALAGLIIAAIGMRYGLASIRAASNEMPFWVTPNLSWKTVAYTAGLALFGAAIVGILPALRVTRVNVQDALRNEGAARAGLRFGGFWTAMIVMQVAIPVALLPVAAGGVYESNRFNERAAGIGAEHYLIAGLAIDREDYGQDSTAYKARVRRTFDLMEQRLGAEPGVEGVAFADRLPVEDQFKYQIAVDSTLGAPPGGTRRSTLVNVSAGFFRAFGTRTVAGRGFEPLDFETGHVMLVNESFGRYVLGGTNPLGQRIRIVSGEVDALAGDTWYEIVGVVKDFGWQLQTPAEQSAMYLPSTPGVGRASQLAVRVRDPGEFSARLRQVAAEVDPTVRLTDVKPLASAGGGEATINWALTAVGGLILIVVLTLSATGIHALMAFTVARRTREIGIRVALGANRGRIVRGIFWRAFAQVGGGIAVGTALSALIGIDTPRHLLLVLGADALMLTAGLIACAVPVRRALAIQPTEALRAEG